MNKKQFIFLVGIVISLIAMYCGYYYFQRRNVAEQENVTIQSMTPCSENSDCTSGNCYGGYCQPCKSVGGQCTSNGNCCLSECDTQVGMCGVGALTIGAAAAVGGAAAYTYHNTGQWVGGKRYSKNTRFKPIYDEDIDPTVTPPDGEDTGDLESMRDSSLHSWNSSDMGDYEETAEELEEGLEVAEA